MTFDMCRDRKTQTWVIYRTGGLLEQHAHLRTRKSCYMLINLIKQGVLPRSQYLQGSCRRLLTEDEFQKLKKSKDHYINNPRRPNHG